MRNLRVLPLLSALLLSGCSGGWWGDAEPPALPGTRIPVLIYDQQMKADPALSAPLLPQAVRNSSWPTAGGPPAHSGGALELAATPKAVWRADMGQSLSESSPLLPVPVIAGERLFAMDSAGKVSAMRVSDGEPLWAVNLAPRAERNKVSGGGLAIADGRLFATLGTGAVLALDPDTGNELWRTALPAPLRSPPAVGNGQVFAVSIDNQLAALSAQDGSLQWVHNGISEAAGLLGAPAPAVHEDVVLVAYSSGELYALRTQNGGELWSDNLAGGRQQGGVMSIAAIRGHPVLAGNGAAALAISNAGRLVAIDTRSGNRVWDQRLAGQQMPWVAGDTVYVVSSTAQLLALNLSDGRVRWVQQLAQWRDAEDKEGLISWYGPVLAGGLLWLTNSDGQLAAFAPADGSASSLGKAGGRIGRPPLVADGTLYTYDDEARLTAWR